MLRKVALVTGAASGTGAATARALATDGYSVAILDRDEAGAQTVAQEIASQSSSTTVAITTDVSDPASVQASVNAAIKQFGRIDALVNNAGYGIAKGLEDTTDAEWDALMATNVKGAFLCARATVPHLRASEGTIVNIGSVAGQVGLRNRVAYCASKAAIHGLTKALAVDLAEDNIRVNAVAPGTVMGPYYDNLRDDGESTEVFHQRLAARQLMGRCGTPEEIAAAVAFLVGPTSSFATGTILVVDGGLSAQ